MVQFPNGKINIGLQITGKRPDGYHDLQTIFYPIDIKDIIESISSHYEGDEITFSSSGLPVDGEAMNNLCIKAYQLIKKDYPYLPSIKLHLHKAIPMGAGLGGGSADGAFTLKLLNEKFDLNLSENKLIEYALALGSDCPFFILNTPSYATGRGELLQPISLTLTGYSILIVNPNIHINTAWAFKELKLKSHSIELAQAIKEPMHNWKELITNDFEEPVFKTHPAISELKNYLYRNGAIYASMSGSGSTIFGIFKNNMRPELIFPETYFHKWV